MDPTPDDVHVPASTPGNPSAVGRKSVYPTGMGSPTRTGGYGSGLAPSLPLQDLSQDMMLASAPRAAFDGSLVPSLGGILILAKLGQGGMGVVYYGMHTGLNKEVAVKVLPFHLAQQNPDAIRRFFREAQCAARIQSPNLVAVTDVREENGLYFLVMEYVSGMTAHAYLKKIKKSGEPGIREDVALEICIAATQGLAAAHAEGVIHRDVKPENIMIPLGAARKLAVVRSKLADLGLAHTGLDESGVTQSGVCMGTAGFMPPEQIDDAKTCGKPADVFAMGATLYALISGDSPFNGGTLMKTLRMTVDQPHPPIRSVRPEVSAATAEVLDRCLEKDPAKRYPDASELLAALKECSHLLAAANAPAKPVEPDSSKLRAPEMLPSRPAEKEHAPEPRPSGNKLWLVAAALGSVAFMMMAAVALAIWAISTLPGGNTGSKGTAGATSVAAVDPDPEPEDPEVAKQADEREKNTLAALRAKENKGRQLSAANVAALVPQLLKFHLTQHDMTPEFMRRLLDEYVTQLDPQNLFFLKVEADDIVNERGGDLKKLSEEILAGNLSRFESIARNFLETQMPRDAVIYYGLKKRERQIKQLAAITDDSETTRIDWTHRPATHEERIRRMKAWMVSLYKTNVVYLPESEAFAISLLAFNESRNVSLGIDPSVDVPTLFMKAFMLALDSHSAYYESEGTIAKDFSSYCGIGCHVRRCMAGALIESLIDGGPAKLDGRLASGDRIVAVDGTRVAGLTLDDITQKLKGAKGTAVKLAIMKKDATEEETITLARNEILSTAMKLKTKTFKTATGTVGYLYVQTIYYGLAADVTQRIAELKRENMAGLVLDLRGNTGGGFTDTIDFAGLFLPAGNLCAEEDASGKVTWQRRENANPFKFPVVVLVNQQTASAAEDFTGMLQDYDRALVVGATQTYGKGVVQHIVSLKSQNMPGEVKVTAFQCFLPKGSSTQLHGITPDITIPGWKLAPDYLESAFRNPTPWHRIDSGLDETQRDVRRWKEWKERNLETIRHASQERTAANAEFKQAFQPKPAASAQAGNAAKNDPKEERDFQLEEAVEIVKDMLRTWPD